MSANHSEPTAAAGRQPNLLIIQADQTAAQWLPCYGHPVVQMPHLRELATRSVVFDNAYCNSPLCVPSRPSMLTGQLPSRIGSYDCGSDFPASLPCFSHYLRLLGYRTILAGKMHFIGPDQLHGFEERLTTEIYVSDFSWTVDWTRYDQRQEASYTMDGVMQAGVCLTSLQIDYDEEVAHQVKRKLLDLARDADPRPFCLVVSFTHPHDPYVISQEYWDRYEGAEIDLPRVPAIPFDQLDRHSQRIWRDCAMDQATIGEKEMRAARRAYYGALSYVDDKIGQLIGMLKATGQYENTIIIFTSDHGDMLGERGLWYKMGMFEPAVRIPLLLHAPAWFAPRRVNANVSLVDLLPTLLDLGQLGQDGQNRTAPLVEQGWAERMDGQSLLPLLQGDERQARDRVCVEYLADGIPTPLLMIRQGRYKYIFSDGDPELLFDLASDPTELHNRVGDPAYADVLADLRQQCQQQWDVKQLRRQIIADQQRRRLISRAMQLGKRTHWDFQPFADATQQYIRPHLSPHEILWRARYPVVC